uniref:Ubiquitin-like protease family profile domain-containing protein n=1 Tax=Tanacetum cinerariifolium TaxID=118510 RepID=A0A6L2NTJ9_TANCI|nr:hypothetical protein [Tanacetum cinerariifolium]
MESVMKSIEERVHHKREYDSMMNERQIQSKEGKVDSSKALDAGLVVTKCSGTKSHRQDTKSRSGNDTHAEDVDIKPVNDKELMVEVDRNTTLDSTNMCHKGGEIDQNAKMWKPTGRILKIAGLRWIPTRKMFIDSTANVDNEPPNGSNEDITNPYECKQTLNTTLQASLLKEKKGVRFSTLYLQKKRNLLVFDHSHQHLSYFPMLVQSLSGSTLGLVTNLIPQQPFNPPIRDDWDRLIQPMFDEYFNSPTIVVSSVPVDAAPRVIDLADSPVSTSIDQDAPSTSILQLVLLGVEDRRPVPNWILRAYFDGRSFEEEQIPRQLNQNNYFEVPSEMYRDFEEQRRGYQQLKEKNADMYEKLTRFMENTRRVPEAQTTPIIADQHFGVSDMSGFQSYQPGTSNWQNQMPSRRQDAGILDSNLCDRARREPQPSVYMLSPYTNLPPTTVLTKKKVDKTKKKGKTTKLSPLNLRNNFAAENVSVDDLTITGVHQTDNDFNYETVDPDKVTRDGYVSMTVFLLDPYDIYLDYYMKGYKLPSFFWPQLVLHVCTYRRERSWPEGWLSSDHMDSLVQILIRERTENANWTLAKSGTVCLHPKNNRFIILTDPHIIGTLDGSVRPFPSRNDVTWVYMPINDGEVHWVTGAINLTDSIFYVLHSLESESQMLMLEQQVNNWTPVINSILETRGYFHATGRRPHNF